MEQRYKEEIWSTVLHGVVHGHVSDPLTTIRSLIEANDCLFNNPLPSSASPAAEVPQTEAIPAQPAAIAEADLPSSGVKAEAVPEPECEKMVPPDDEPESNAYDGPDDAKKFVQHEVTKDMIREAAIKAGARFGREFVVGEFASHGASGLRDLDPKHYADIYKAFCEGEH